MKKHVDRNDKSVRIDILGFLRYYYGQGFEGEPTLSDITGSLGISEEDALPNLRYMEEKNWIISSIGHSDSVYQITTKGMDELDKHEVVDKKQESIPVGFLKAKPSFLIEKLEALLKELQKLKKMLNGTGELPLIEVSKKIRNLLLLGFKNGKERVEKFNIEGGNFYKDIQSATTQITNSHNLSIQDIKYLQNITWHEMKINEVLDEVRLSLEIQRSNSVSKTQNIPSFMEADFHFLDIKNTIDAFYTTLFEQINKSYHYKLYTVTQILIRKLFENLVIDILRKKYKNDVNSYQNPKARYHQFHIIMSNARQKITNGDFDSVKKDFEEALNWISKLRDEGSKSAHSITFDVKKEELDNIRDEIIRKTNLLNRVFGMT